MGKIKRQKRPFGTLANIYEGILKNSKKFHFSRYRAVAELACLKGFAKDSRERNSAGSEAVRSIQQGLCQFSAANAVRGLTP